MVLRDRYPRKPVLQCPAFGLAADRRGSGATLRRIPGEGPCAETLGSLLGLLMHVFCAIGFLATLAEPRVTCSTPSWSHHLPQAR
jgi:hypothetical protein